MPRITLSLSERSYLQLTLLNRAVNARSAPAADEPIEATAQAALERGLHAMTRAWYSAQLAHHLDRAEPNLPCPFLGVGGAHDARRQVEMVKTTSETPSLTLASVSEAA
jgi:hypothetical protein